MTFSKQDSKNDTKQNAGASTTEQSKQDVNKTNGANAEPQNPSILAKDKDLSQQGAQSHKTDGAASEQSGKEATSEEGGEASTGTSPASTGGKSQDGAQAVSAKSTG